jgi:hypothetical protein
MLHHDQTIHLPTPDSGREAGCDRESEISEAFESLMSLAFTISESKWTSASLSYLNAVALDRQLSEWYERLPAALKWSTPNIEHASSDFLLLQ